VIKVAIYEDNDSLRESLCIVLNNCTINAPDVILMDVDMPGISGIEASALVTKAFPKTNILILTVFEDQEKLFNALQSGASGYLLKKSKIIEIIEAIHDIYKGGSPMTPAIARKVLDFFSKPQNQPNPEEKLSERELDILKCLVAGDSYKMIASNCFISMGTVRSHINNIYKKLHVNSKSEAVVKALKERLV
jgi:two-component system, NarL family, response regulator LiaR